MVIVNYNGKEYLKDAIPTVCSIDYPGCEVIVVDNGSTDGSVEWLKKNKNITLLQSPKIGEKNYACNMGVQHASGEYILLLDNDLMITDRNILAKLVKEYESLPDCGSISLAYVNRNSQITQGYGCYTSYYYSWEKPNIDLTELKCMHQSVVGSPNGAGLFIKKETWNKQGGYDDHLAFGGDDDDLGIRLWMNGYRNYLFSETVQVHIGLAERTDTFKYSNKFQKKVYAHLFTIVKDFRFVNMVITMVGYLLFSFSKSIKQSIARRSYKPFTSTLHGYIDFVRNIPVAIKKRKRIQSERKIKRDVFLDIRPSFVVKHGRIATVMSLFFNNK